MKRGTLRSSAARILLITFVSVLMVVPTACSESTSGTRVRISMADREVKQDQSFTVEVRIETDTACRGAQCVLSFDPALMKCDGVVEGGFLKDWAAANGASTLMIPQLPTIDNSQGHVSITGIAVMGVAGGGGAKGSGVLFTYHFTALGDGTAEPTLSDVVVSDVSGQAIPEVEVNN
jgi:hypothetical protein